MTTNPDPGTTLSTDDTPMPFAAFLQQHGRGRTHDELSESFHELISRVGETGRKGSITLTVTVGPVKQDERMLVVEDTIRVKLPEHDRPAGLWFRDPITGQLTKDDPDQPTITGLVVLDKSTGEVLDPYTPKEQQA